VVARNASAKISTGSLMLAVLTPVPKIVPIGIDEDLTIS
jgi:hypothetical protein